MQKVNITAICCWQQGTRSDMFQEKGKTEFSDCQGEVDRNCTLSLYSYILIYFCKCTVCISFFDDLRSSAEQGVFHQDFLYGARTMKFDMNVLTQPPG